LEESSQENEGAREIKPTNGNKSISLMGGVQKKHFQVLSVANDNSISNNKERIEKRGSVFALKERYFRKFFLPSFSF